MPRKMTNKEAIRRLENHFRVHDDGRPTPYLDEAVSMAIEALSQIDELQRKIDIDHAEYTNLWAENQRLSQERPKGRWIDTYYENSTGNIYNCSNCEVLYNPNKKDVELNRVKEKPKFCPNCGADMRESEQE